MRKICCIAFFVVCAQMAIAQAVVSDSGTFLLHKFQQNIGREKYIVIKSAGAITYNIDFKFVDRGSPVSLKSVMQVTTALEPLSFTIKGSTSRFSTIDDSIVIHQKTAIIKVGDSSYSKSLKEISFPIAGYSPGTAQMLILQYWKKHNKPAVINMLPSGTMQIKKDGQDTIPFNKNSIVLERYVISGLVWGNELLWTDAKGELYCLITNDAEGDKLEMMAEPYEALLPVLIDKAAIYGMRLFISSTKPSLQVHPVIALTGGTVINVLKGVPIPDAVVLIEEGIIKQIGIRGAVTIPANAYIINAKGKTILPGLWDMHSHFEQAEWGPAHLAAGVTTVRDCGNEFGYINAIQKAIDEGQGIGPHILKAGIIDGKGSYSLGIIQADTKEEAIKAVQRYKENGFVQIKIYSSVRPEIVKVICAEAHHLGLSVTGHIPFGMSLQQGIDSGMDQVNHIQYVFSAMNQNKHDGLINFSDSVNLAVLNFLKVHHVVVDPTLSTYELAFRSLKDSITIIEPAFASLPQPLKPLFINTGLTSDSDIEYTKTLMRDFKQIVNALYHDSIAIVAGTDMGIPGFSLDRELELYVDAGLTPMQAIQAATIVPAKVMNRQIVSGSIDVGKQADLVIIDGDPLHNIRNIRKVTTVIKEGKIYDPVELHHQAGFQ